MVKVLFYCHNKRMDVIKLFEKVMKDDEVRDIPLMYVFTVVCCVVEAISSGECFYKTEFD